MERIIKKMGSWLFLIGIIGAVIVGIVIGAYGGFNNITWDATPITAVLAIIGFVIGVLSFFALGTITHERVPTFLIAALLLVGLGVASSTWTFGNWAGLKPFFVSIIQLLSVFVAPAACLLAIRAIWDAGKSEEIEKLFSKIPK